jgi:hypothetical protein
VAAALIAAGFIAGATAGSVISAIFVLVAEATGLSQHFGHHGEILSAILALSIVAGMVYVPIRWRALIAS